MSKLGLFFSVASILAGTVFGGESGSGRVTPNLDKGTKLLEGSGYIDVMGDDLQIQLAYGQFVADGIEIAVVAGLRDNDRYMSTELGARAEYNIVRHAALVPFLGTSVVWSDVEADDSALNADAAVFSFGGGVKHFIRDAVALAVNGSYLVATDEIFVDSEDGELQDDEFRFLFSVRFYFD